MFGLSLVCCSNIRLMVERDVPNVWFVAVKIDLWNLMFRLSLVCCSNIRLVELDVPNIWFVAVIFYLCWNVMF